jgi:hypothetical protein
MAPPRPLFGYETIGWQMVLRGYLKEAGYVPARFPSTCLSTDCYRAAVSKPHAQAPRVRAQCFRRRGKRRRMDCSYE